MDGHSWTEVDCRSDKKDLNPKLKDSSCVRGKFRVCSCSADGNNHLGEYFSIFHDFEDFGTLYDE